MTDTPKGVWQFALLKKPVSLGEHEVTTQLLLQSMPWLQAPLFTLPGARLNPGKAW